MFALVCRTLETVNTDPLRRCYDGGHAKSEERFSPWKIILLRKDRQSLEETAITFKKYSYKGEYRIEEVPDDTVLGLEKTQ